MLKKEDISDSLLKWNYFPVQKKDREEIPPIFNSSMFDKEVAKSVIRGVKARAGGYDQVEYRSTRFTNVPRALSIPHPRPYAELCLEIQSNWEEISSIEQNTSSIIKPQAHKDGRLIIMDYDSSQRFSHRHLNKSLGMKFVVHTDISNFFNSIYTHAIPWALVGFSEAKKNQDPNEWYNKLDKLQRQCKRDETMGVPIGPATSNIFAESILQRVDERLRGSGYSFSRYIDDYTGYCKSNEEAECFISDLGKELKRFKLILNLNKTYVLQLPEAASDDWVADLSTRLPKTKKVTFLEATRYLDYAVSIQRKTPDGSVLKFAVKAISSRVDIEARLSLVKYALNLAFHYPVIIPLLDPLLIGLNVTEGFDLEGRLLKILTENISCARSDGMSWTIYLLRKHCLVRLSENIVDKIIETQDCISITMLYLIGGCEDKVIKFANQIVSQDLYAIDEQWLLLYQMFLDGKIKNPYSDASLYSGIRKKSESEEDVMRREVLCFNRLKEKKISFIDLSCLKRKDSNSFKELLLSLNFKRIRKRIGV
ncbi:antiviral reverse transcriptase Drt4 [Microbulbifer echini]|uniref:Antiviral reverse transcriptase Drt4 n=1 Tax=Microbulbifer echini TaxID=1529067 RepID=A0ABV4NLC6_9GAMM